MPRKNSLKQYVEGGFYHVYNRGVEKRKIFMNSQDYKVFLDYLKFALSEPPDPNKYMETVTFKGEPFRGLPRLPINFHSRIDLLAFNLLPNHFHLLIKQTDSDSIKSFTSSILTRYSMYFNKKYNRVGTLFQGPYKAVLITDDNYLLHLSRYIHLNSFKHGKNSSKTYSSYQDYLGNRKLYWVKTDHILKYFDNRIGNDFKKHASYQTFVEDMNIDSDNILKTKILEN